jgi:N-acetylneuraminic acid mutarotase
MVQKLVSVIIAVLAISFILSAIPVQAVEVTVGNSWASKASMQVPRSDLGVASVNGKIYALGGVLNGETLGTNEEYDPATNTWTYKSPMPTPLSGFAVAIYQGKIYCIGGSVNEVYDPSNDSWTMKTPMPTPRSYLSAAVMNDKMYLIGGAIPDKSAPNGYSSIVGTNEEYDPLTDSWAEKAPMLNVTSGSGVTVDNKIYVIGYLQENKVSTITLLEQVYDPQTDDWNISKTPHLYEAGISTSGIYAPRQIYFFKYRTQYELPDFQGTQYYLPTNGTWGFGANMPTTRQNFVVISLNDKIYVIGGYTVFLPESLSYTEPLGSHGIIHYLATVEEYTPFGYGTVPPEVSINTASDFNSSYGDVSFSITANKPIDWMKYNLDGAGNVTTSGNVTLTGLAVGAHNVTVYACDGFGNVGASETISFTVNSQPANAAFATAVAIATIAVVAIVLGFYYRKRRRPVGNV